MTVRAVDVLDGYLARYPGAREARASDAEYAASVHLLRRFALLLDMAMEDEGVSEETRMRVLRLALYGSLDPAPAEERDQLTEQLRQALERNPIPLRVVPPVVSPTNRGPQC